MPIEAGQQLLHYRLIEKIGEGGMGAVWRAADTTLNRDVALKLLPQLFADDPERLARFEREAKLLASLNHPNIAAVYGLHQADDAETGSIRFLTMELVEGEDLSKRIARGALPVERALDVAVQMAAGIEAAHDRGVIHRDLKPANVILTPDGRVKLLDFGLAKAFESNADGSDPSFSPTMTSTGTVAGMILGTAAYMSPEQARGKAVDRRADLWSFGCVLYECFTGKGLFGGETVSDSLAAILRKDPDFSELPVDTPPMVRLLLRRCLTRDPNKRLRDAGDARLELEQAIDDPRIEALGIEVAGEQAGVAQPARTRWLPWTLASLALVAALFFAIRGGPVVLPDASVRLTIPVGGTVSFGDDGGSPPAVSPDGRFVVFGLNDDTGVNRLWLRPFDSFELQPLAGTEGGNNAFWSPDSRHVGFFVDGRLKRVEIASGRMRSVDAEVSTRPRGGSWGAGGRILFAPDSNSGIWIVDTAGGAARQLTVPDPEIPDSSHRWPHFLPDGEHFLFLQWTNELRALEQYGGVYVGSIHDDEPPVRVTADVSSMAYAPTGQLLVMQEANLMAVPFDVGTRKVVGEAVVLAGDVLYSTNNGHAAFSISAEGTLVYARGRALVPPATLFWFDRDGEMTPVPIEAAPLLGKLRLAPDGRRAATVLPGVTGDGEIWVIDLIRGARTRLGPAAPFSFDDPLWSPRGDRLLYISQKAGAFDFYARRADGSGDEESLLIDEADKVSYDWSRDGRQVVYWQVGSGAGPSLSLYDTETRESTVLAEDGSTYLDARFSPDSRHVTYASDDSGRMEIHIQRIADGARWQVSTGGGSSPHWSDDGSEIVYLDPDRRMMSVAVELSTGQPTLSTPRELFTVHDWIVAFEPAGDHRRFLFATREETDVEPLRVILDWPSGL